MPGRVTLLMCWTHEPSSPWCALRQRVLGGANERDTAPAAAEGILHGMLQADGDQHEYWQRVISRSISLQWGFGSISPAHLRTRAMWALSTRR